MQYLDLNPKKFQFCQEEVEFAGFLLTPTMVKPLPKYIDSIRNDALSATFQCYAQEMLRDMRS